MTSHHENSLSPLQIETFISDGFIKLENAFSRELADAGREILWRDTGCDEFDPSTWTQPVIRLNDYPQKPFRQAVNSPILLKAFDDLVGVGRWQPRGSLGTWPIRFPSEIDPGDAGWHAEASYPGDDGSWRLNVHSRGRALLMLFLFSDVGENDAPTRIQIGSHFDVARILEPAGEAGMNFIELAEAVLKLPQRPVTYATGKAGTVFLCHPFLFHAAQLHHGTTPRFMAQPPLLPAEPLQLHRENADYSPVETAIRLALE